MTAGNDDLEELASEIQRLIKSNKEFLERVNDEEYDADDLGEESEGETEEELEDYEEL